MMEAIQTLSKNTTVLLVEQNFIMASRLAHQYTIIDDGESVQAGAMKDLIEQPDIIHHYLGASIKHARIGEGKCLRKLKNFPDVAHCRHSYCYFHWPLPICRPKGFCKYRFLGAHAGFSFLFGGSWPYPHLWLDGRAELCTWLNVHVRGLHWLAVLH